MTKLKVLLKVYLLKLKKEKQNSSLDAQDMFKKTQNMKLEKKKAKKRHHKNNK